MSQNPLVSIIVTTRNEERNIENCLNSLKNQTYKDIEIVVVDNGSSDKTKELAGKYTDKVFDKGPERSAQRNFGVKNSSGKYVLILDCDMILSENVVQSGIKEFEKNPELKALVIPEESYGEGFWANCKKLERSFYVGVDWMEASRFFDKEIFEEFEGYDENNTGTEDFDLPQRIKFKYGDGSIGRTSEFIYHNEGKLSLLRSCKKKFYYAQRLDSYTSKKENKNNFSNQSSFLKRYSLFFKKPAKLFKNPLLGFGMLFMKTSEMGFGSMGYLVGKFRKIENIYK